ncbi:MAG: hypothetical protein ACPGO3_00165 [Magnetospiraceae bacterium]
MDNSSNKKENSCKDDATPAVSLVLDDGTVAEMVYDETEGKTAFAVWDGTDWSLEKSLSIRGKAFRPYAPGNTVVRQKVVLLPTEPEDYGTEADLIAEIEGFIARYVDLTPEFTRLACRYVLLTWLHDRFNELPYLRLRGDYGTGKTRFLLIVGSLCYKPIFANGASTVSPLFHLLDTFKGTLILDEADFRFSDEKADVVKILNAGNVRGIPILRTMMNKNREFDPRAFSVFGPKIIAGRGQYEDQALESRCITEETRTGSLRAEIPLNLPDAYETEALALRNKLLLCRFRNFHKTAIEAELANPAVDNRINQIYLPLLSVTADEAVRDELIERQTDNNARLAEERGMAIEAQVLEIIHDLQGDGAVRLKDIAARFRDRHGDEYRAPISSRFIGAVIRTKLAIRTHKSNGIYVVPVSENPKLSELFKRYGINDEKPEASSDIQIVPVDNGEIGDSFGTVIT